MVATIVIALSASASGGTTEADNKGAVTAAATAAPNKCPSARGAVRFYSRRMNEWRAMMGAPPSWHVTGRGCPRYLAHLLQRKSRAARRAYERWDKKRTLRPHRDWQRAVREAQKPYPGTEDWLLSCSASEGAHGLWVPNRQGSGAGGWLQFMESTFWRMWGAALADVRARGWRVPASAASWYSPLGQALAGAWGVTNGRRGEWYGSGC